MKHIVSFSGGKDSTAMLLMMLEKGMPVDRVICVDTTKEFPQMYEHIKKVQEYINPLEIEIITIPFDYYFAEHIKTKGRNKEFLNVKGFGWPDMNFRWCTTKKLQAQTKAVKVLGDYIRYIGIASDEAHRTKSNKDIKDTKQFPLVKWGITEKQALEYCYSKGFDWGGLYTKMRRVSCWCCPLSSLRELKVLYNDFPELWKQLEEMDKKSVRQFRADYSVADLTKRFAEDKLQLVMNLE